jgi:subtilisin-like proprotein convertase family protein
MIISFNLTKDMIYDKMIVKCRNNFYHNLRRFAMRVKSFMLVLATFLLLPIAVEGQKATRTTEPTSGTTKKSRSLSKAAMIRGRLSRGTKGGIPGLMSFQGTLTDDSGTALDTTVDMTFRIYTDSTGVSIVWSESQLAVAVGSGIFNVLLGSVNPISDTVFSDHSRWLGVQIGGDPELEPRQRITSAGYAFRAMKADTADYARSAAAGIDGDWTIAGDDMYSAVSGNVGIGTTSPTTLFEVDGDVKVGDELQVRAVHGGGQVSMTFMQIVASPNTPWPIWDNAPPGVTDTLTFPDLGLAQNLIVSVDLSNSNIAFIEVYLTDPNLNEYTLYYRDSTGTELATSYPYPTPPVSGDLTSWIGQNPQGDWFLKVVDLHFLNNNWDGQVNSWGVSITTTSGNTVHVRNGNFVVDEELGIGTTDPARNLHVNDVMRLQPRTDVPSDPAKGDMYVRDSDGKLMVYDGSTWQACW